MTNYAGRLVPAKPKPVIEADTILDGHSHCEEGATAPLCLVWNQMPWYLKPEKPARSLIDILIPLQFASGGKLQRKSTQDIGGLLILEKNKTYTDDSIIRQANGYKKAMTLFTPSIILEMDLDYAQIAAFPPESSQIYHERKFEWTASLSTYEPPTKIIVDGVYYYERKNGLSPEKNGKIIDVTNEKPNGVWKYKRYFDQHSDTVEAVKNNPWQLIPMFHYDPRRWCNPIGGELIKNGWIHGPLDFPFQFIATKDRPGLFIGFKMYPPLGYKPLDPRLPHLDTFYSKCEAEGIPIMVHCSPGGMTTHEAKYYYEYDKADLAQRPDRLVSCSYDPCTPVGYFYDNYVHPKNWRPVLMKYPKLKLCLAHFGGDEWKSVGLASDWVEEIKNLTDPCIVQGRNNTGEEIKFENVYTDMSCFDLKNEDQKKAVQEFFRGLKKKDCPYKHLREKLFFGTDWYLTLLTEDTVPYKEFCELFYKTVSDIDEYQWYRMSLVNSAAFYGLDDLDIINNINKELNASTDTLDDDSAQKIQDGYQRMMNIKDQVEKIKKELQKL